MYYNMSQIERVACLYVNSGGDGELFQDLLTALTPLIKHQLRKSYFSLNEFWDDMEQECVLRLWRNRESLLHAKSRMLFSLLNFRIRDYLRMTSDILQGRRRKKQVRMGYDGVNSDTESWDETKDYGDIEEEGKGKRKKTVILNPGRGNE